MNGVVVKYNSSKGYGFIRSEQQDKDLFFHISSMEGKAAPEQGQRVSFKLEKTAKGPAAVEITVGRQQSSPFMQFALLSLVLVAAITAYLALHINLLLAYFIAINTATFLLYGYDKAIAGTGKLRVPERVLNTLALLGGSPVALLAQQLFRHKTAKNSFQLAFWAVVVVQVLVAGYFL